MAAKLPRNLLQLLKEHSKQVTGGYTIFTPSQVPTLHWCGHYYDDTHTVIPDGNNCCFWHWIGLPQRWGVRHPAYPWQEEIFDEYYRQKLRYFYIGKTPKIGASQTWLQIAIHEAITNPNWRNGQVAIVVGTGGNEAEKMIDRCKELLAYKDDKGIPIRDENGDLITKLPINQDYNTKKEFSVNSVEFRAYPANNVDSIRSKPNMKMEIVDEIGFFTMVEQSQVRAAFEHYIGNSDVVIALITTAGKSAGGVAYDIEIEDPSIYKHHLLDYTIGLIPHPESNTTLYNPIELEKLKSSTSWVRNYLRVWGHGSGNIFNSETIDQISKDFYPLDDIRGYPNVLAIDPAYGQVRDKTSSKFAGVGMWLQNGHYYIRSYFELEGAANDEAMARVKKELDEFGYKALLVDGAHPGVIKQFQSYPGITSYGVNYSQEGVNLIDGHARAVEDLKLHVHPTFTEICQQQKAVRRGDNGLPNKKQTRFDLGDCVSQGIWHLKEVGVFHARKIKRRL